MKAFGHTKTLFIQAGKYKWSYKHDFCVQCRTVTSKHKGKGLCTKCFDKNRSTESRVIQNKIRSNKFHYKTRALQYLEKTEHKKKKVNFTKEDFKEYQKERYQINKEVISLERKANRMKKNGETVLTAIINGKEKYFPFSDIEKQPRFSDEKFEAYREKDRQYILLRDYYS